MPRIGARHDAPGEVGPAEGKKLCLTWTWNPQPLSTAVANSVTMIATKYGMNVSLLCPNPDYVLDERFMKVAHENAASSGGRLAVTHDISEGYADADVVYANSWGSLPYYGDRKENGNYRGRTDALSSTNGRWQ